MGHDIIAKAMNYDNNYVDDMTISGASELYKEFYALMGVSSFIEETGGVGWKTYTNKELKHIWKVAHTFISDKWRRKNVKQFLRNCINKNDDIEISFI
jgi:hypothetical protein